MGNRLFSCKNVLKKNRIFKSIHVIWSIFLGILIGCVLSFLWDFENLFEYLWEGICNA